MRNRCLQALACLVVVMLSPVARAADAHGGDAISPVQRARLQVLLKGTAEAIRKDYYDPNLKGIDMAAAEAKARDRIAVAANLGDVFAAIADFTLTLDDSHTHFYPPRLTGRVHYGWTMMMVGDTCYVDRVIRGSDAERQGVHRGDRVLAINGFPPTRGTLFNIEYLFYSLRPQPGLHVELLTPAGERRELDLAARFEKRPRLLDVTGANGADIAWLETQYEKYDLLGLPRTIAVGDDVAIVRIPSFSVEPVDVRTAMREARKHSGGIVFDLRGNHGGYVVTLDELYGLVSGGDANMGTNVGRKRAKPEIAKGSGAAAYTGRVFVLIDSESASASEVFARTVQLQNRGTVVGDRSAGAVMESIGRAIVATEGEKIMVAALGLTVADVVMPDGGRLEKTGVTPDFPVVPTAADLAAGRDPALARTLKFLGHDVDAADAWKLVHDAKDESEHLDD